MRIFPVMVAAFSVAVGLCAQDRVLVVPETHRSVEAALAEARSGDTVRVNPGTWAANVTIPSGVSLRGAGAKKTILRGVGTEPVITLAAAKKVTIEGLALEHPLDDEAKDGSPVLLVGGGPVTIARCMIRNGHGHGIMIEAGEKITLDSCDVRGCAGWGVVVLGSTATLQKGSVAQNGVGGIFAYRGGQLRVIGTTVKGHGGIGVRVRDPKTLAELTDVTSQLNHFGAECSGGGTLKIRGGGLDENEKAGLYVRDPGSSFDVQGTRLKANNGSGAEATLGAQGQFRKVEAQGNKGPGITAAHAGTRIEIHDCVVTENKSRGIFIQQGAWARCKGNTCNGNDGTGIGVFDKGTKGTIESNRCRNNGQHGISVSGLATGTVRGNVTESNKLQGIAVIKKADATLEKNHCIGNERNGIQVWARARAVLRLNVCDRNTHSGIEIAGEGSTATFSRNRCRKNGHWGVSHSGGAERPEVGRDNELSSNNRGKVKR